MTGERRPTPFGDLQSPQPPSALRLSVLEAAEAALQREPTPDLWSRIWRSRRLRLVWAGLAAALIVAHIAITPMGRATGRATIAASATGLDTELEELVRWTRLRRDARPWHATELELAALEDASQHVTTEDLS